MMIIDKAIIGENSSHEIKFYDVFLWVKTKLLLNVLKESYRVL